MKVMPPISIKYLAKVNGKRAINGTEYGVTIKGDGDLYNPNPDAYDLLAQVGASIREQNQEMEIVVGMQITVVFDPPMKVSK